jgi:peptidoglycan-associated lipoprotein
LDRYVSVLNANPDLKVLVEGHCDERGTEEYNLALGERRANRVKTYLVNAGVDASRLKTISYGELRPKAQGSNEEAWALNRRAHFKLSQ